MSTKTFSALDRNSTIKQMENEHFDLLVIGGGITGSGIVLDAVNRGLKVGLIERNDFASGTSSRSGKLIHGGLKYLQKLDFNVIKEIGSERDIVYNNARHLVYPIKMNFPLIKRESYNLLTLKAGLSLYDRLAGVKKDERHTIYGKKKTLQYEPLFNEKTVTGSGAYVEYRTDDSRLTLEVAKTASEKGATVLNYAEMTDFLQDENNHVKGVIAKDLIQGQNIRVTATHVVNAAGPWVDEVRKKDRPITGKYMVLAKGIHIVFDHQSLPVKSSIYFQHKGRMIAVIPRGNRTYVGSTESIYKQDMDDIHVKSSEVDYLIDCLHAIFPSLDLGKNDVVSSWAGIRPLIGEDGNSPSELSRHDEIFESDTGLITIAGGKLTGYRKMAERVLQHIEKKDSSIKSKKTTDQLKLSGGHFNSQEAITAHVPYLHGKFKHLNLSIDEVNDYVFRYGSNTENLLKLIDRYDDRFEDKELRNIAAEVRYTVEHEMAASLADFYDRRTSYLLFDLDKVIRTLTIVAEEMAQLLEWTEARTADEIEKMNYEIKKALTFVE
ncbi:glycerol-3-phosphate dehydrogenase [Virgibacillus subterraneus]|uniref:Aerobic glycerol-3-phosphate dehydrogenase n=1 Tax=Virgibacillus subterraneus TaxID=621109 RepID=A0A1H9AMX8_9BACI|nr:glycerol-3-phosphate dehydrogenase/oxidase [Virgibacillus subterraneus]SEP77723.1 glycerol-3-phosphate dehydrogenase [Virgibacillus subterraneus]